MTTNDEVPLKILAKNYFKERYLYKELEANEKIRGKSGQKWKFDGVIETDKYKFGVFIKDWKRSIGVNQVRLLEKACYDTGFDGGLLVGKDFSSHAIVYGENKGIQIVKSSDLTSRIN